MNLRNSIGLPLLVSLLACSGDDGGSTAPAEVARSEKQRIGDPTIPAEDQQALIDGNTDFAFALHQELRGTEGNMIYSPLSISTALAMTWAGARTTTESQMAEALRYRLPQAQLHPAMNWLDLELNSRGQELTLDPSEEGQAFELRVVNALWGQRDYEFTPTFLDTIAENYGAGIQLLDFMTAAEEAREAINSWVEEQTNDRIQDLLPMGSVNASTRLVLTNAVYFLASWKNPFDPANTVDAPFTTLAGDTVTVPMMHKTDDETSYAAGDGYQLVELAYVGDELAMIILLPDADRFDEIEASLTGDSVQSMLAQLGGQPVNLELPRFQIELDVSLPEHMMSLGMVDAFGDDADFSGMNGSRSLSITDILHKAFIKVDEEGTEAAAATAVVVGETSAPPPPVDFTCDRPFLFFLRDTATGTILFVGRVVDPR